MSEHYILCPECAARGAGETSRFDHRYWLTTKGWIAAIAAEARAEEPEEAK